MSLNWVDRSAGWGLVHVWSTESLGGTVRQGTRPNPALCRDVSSWELSGFGVAEQVAPVEGHGATAGGVWYLPPGNRFRIWAR